eukprot:TRINITY_DN42957_c0_g1_i1.p1 TRINITY_DN42957_c0_g1~~TRINITY_DN42957_c0_g1_i1.p1  ORF type:complete len:101 (+),score=26.01 TRINITY_DN42957_c0_g1_i1:85-387(+)
MNEVGVVRRTFGGFPSSMRFLLSASKSTPEKEKPLHCQQGRRRRRRKTLERFEEIQRERLKKTLTMKGFCSFWIMLSETAITEPKPGKGPGRATLAQHMG